MQSASTDTWGSGRWSAVHQACTGPLPKQHDGSLHELCGLGFIHRELYQMGDSVASGKRLAVGGHGGRREVRLGTMAAVMVPGFEALDALLSVLSRGADGERYSGYFPESIRNTWRKMRCLSGGRERYRPWQAMRGIPRGRWQGGCGPRCIPGAGGLVIGHPVHVWVACALSGWVAGARGV